MNEAADFGTTTSNNVSNNANQQALQEFHMARGHEIITAWDPLLRKMMNVKRDLIAADSDYYIAKAHELKLAQEFTELLGKLKAEEVSELFGVKKEEEGKPAVLEKKRKMGTEEDDDDDATGESPVSKKAKIDDSAVQMEGNDDNKKKKMKLAGPELKLNTESRTPVKRVSTRKPEDTRAEEVKPEVKPLDSDTQLSIPKEADNAAAEPVKAEHKVDIADLATNNNTEPTNKVPESTKRPDDAAAKDIQLEVKQAQEPAPNAEPKNPKEAGDPMKAKEDNIDKLAGSATTNKSEHSTNTARAVDNKKSPVRRAAKKAKSESEPASQPETSTSSKPGKGKRKVKSASEVPTSRKEDSEEASKRAESEPLASSATSSSPRKRKRRVYPPAADDSIAGRIKRRREEKEDSDEKKSE